MHLNVYAVEQNTRARLVKERRVAARRRVVRMAHEQQERS